MTAVGKGAEDSQANPIKEANQIYDPPYNFYVLPIDGLFGQFSFGVEARISEHWSLGPELSYWKVNAGQIGGNSGVDQMQDDAWRYCLRGTWYQNGAYNNGLYISPLIGAIYSTVEGRWTDKTTYGNSKFAAYTGAMIGYALFAETFGMSFGMGYTTTVSGKFAEQQDHERGWATTEPPNVIGIVGEVILSWGY